MVRNEELNSIDPHLAKKSNREADSLSACIAGIIVDLKAASRHEFV